MQGIFQKENTDKALKYGIYRHLPTYEKIIRNLVSFYTKNWNPYFGSDRKEGWHLLNTKDMVHYGPETAIGILGETGSVIWADGLF